MKYLIEGGADVNYEKEARFGGEIALAEAFLSGNIKAVALLIKAGANLFRHDTNGNSILSTACICISDSFSELIVEKMLSIATIEQKKRIYTFMLCLNSMHARAQYVQFKNLFKSTLRAMIKEENAPKVLAEINGSHYWQRKYHLLKKYFPEHSK